MARIPKGTSYCGLSLVANMITNFVDITISSFTQTCLYKYKIHVFIKNMIFVAYYLIIRPHSCQQAIE